MSFKAFLIDSDDTLTRLPDQIFYNQASYRACQALSSSRVMQFAEYSAMHTHFYEQGLCPFAGIGELLAIDPLAYFHRFHQEMEACALQFDTDSAAALNSLAHCAVIFTDASESWARRSADRVGHKLDILARDHESGIHHRKAEAGVRWDAARQYLSEKAGYDLQPSEILMIDDSARVLRQARQLGFATAQCHFGFPGRASTEFDFSITSVGVFLAAHAVKPAGQKPQSSPAPAA